MKSNPVCKIENVTVSKITSDVAVDEVQLSLIRKGLTIEEVLVNKVGC